MANTTGMKYGGRKKGTPNFVTKDIREAFQKLIEDNLPQLEKDLASLEPKERLKMIVDLSAYVIPKLKATEIALGESRVINIKPIQWVD